jgi:valyl-tRNA synthetase
MPFVTEELWSRLPGDRDFVMRASWPQLEFVDPAAEEDFGQVMRIVEEVRGHRQAAGAPPRGGQLQLDASVGRSVAHLAARLAWIALVDELDEGTPLAAVSGKVSFPAGARREAERKRLQEELAKTDVKLGNADFLTKAPPEIVKKLEDRAAQLRADLDRLT